jgi:hypothetical protein
VSYVVNWQGTDGQPGWHPVADVQEATTFVEHLRNAEGVEATRIFRLEEVAFEFRPYFRVELARAEAPTPTPIAVAQVPERDVVRAPIAGDDDDDADSAANGAARRGLFGR